jgi:hypothetical protein
MFEYGNGALAALHIEELRKEAAEARLARAARKARHESSRAMGRPKRRRGHGLASA